MICLYDGMAKEYVGNGLGILQPISCRVSEQAGGSYELEMDYPITADMRWAALIPGNIIKAPVPGMTAPALTVMQRTAQGEVRRYVWEANGRTNVRRIPGIYHDTIAYMQRGHKCVSDSTGPQNDLFIWATTDRGVTGWVYKPQVTLVAEEVVTPGQEAVVESIPERQVKEQFFRIYEATQALKGDVVRVRARHISYDLLYNLLGTCRFDRDTMAKDAVREIQQQINDKSQPWQLLCPMEDIIPATDYSLKNPIAALLDEQEGVARRIRAMVIRDNWCVYIVPQESRWRGVSIRYGVNMLGVELTTDESGVYTSVFPVGEDQNGVPLYIQDFVVPSPRVNEYPYQRYYLQRVQGAKVGSKDATGAVKTAETVRAELRKAAEDLLQTGIDMPKISMKVDFLDLGTTEEYKQFAGLQKICLYDMVRISHPARGIVRDAMVTAYDFDAVNGRYESITLGDPFERVLSTVTGSQISAGSITGRALGYGSIGSGALHTLAVGSAHIQNAAITAAKIASLAVERGHIQEAAIGSAQIDKAAISSAHIALAAIAEANIQDAAITAAKIASLAVGTAHIQEGAIGSAQIGQAAIQHAHIALAAIAEANIQNAAITAAKIAALAVERGHIKDAAIGSAQIDKAAISDAHIASASITTAKIKDFAAEVATLAEARIQQAQITSAQITDLQAQVSQLVQASIGTADIDWAHIKDLVTGRVIITKGTAGELYIARLAVTEANLVRLSVGELLVRGQDGAFYAVSVDSDGQIITTKKQVENGDIKDATIHAGEKIIDGTVTADKINARDVFADSALIRRLMAENLDVDVLFARQATVTALNTVDISNNEKLRLMVGGVQESANSAITMLRDRVTAAVTQLDQAQTALNGKADKALIQQLGTQLQQTATDITAIIQRTKGLEADQAATDALMRQYQLTFRISADGVTIGKSGSDFDVRIDNASMEFRERGVVVAYISNNRLYVRDAEITGSLTMGLFSWQVLADRSFGLVRGG